MFLYVRISIHLSLLLVVNLVELSIAGTTTIQPLVWQRVGSIRSIRSWLKIIVLGQLLETSMLFQVSNMAT